MLRRSGSWVEWLMVTQCRSSLAVTRRTSARKVRGWNPTADGSVFIVLWYSINSSQTLSWHTALVHGLHTFVSGSTQPSTLRSMVKWISAFRPSNNKMMMMMVVSTIAGRLATKVDWLGPTVGGRWALYIVHSWSSEPGKLLQWLYDSIINIVLIIIIIF